MESKSIDREAVLKSLVLNNSTTDGQPRKRKRLDNLSAEERALRRKLKNRVAAQTARDRKKARMTELEELVAQLEKENRTLRLDNESLRKHSEAVTIENSELRVRLGLTPPVSPAPVSTNYPPTSEASPDTKYSPVVIKKEAEYNEYASLSVSQQQERLILFLSLITTWMMINNSMTWILAFLNLMGKETASHLFSPNKKPQQPQPAVNSTPTQMQKRKSEPQMAQSQNQAAVT
nr:uncharacterized protein LOC131776066 [Pocillopora verrucosa]